MIEKDDDDEKVFSIYGSEFMKIFSHSFFNLQAMKKILQIQYRDQKNMKKE